MKDQHLRKTAVVFGATGLVGSQLVKLLLKDSDYQKVTLVVRHRLTIENPKLEQIQLSDFTRLDTISSQLQASEYFCCIGTTIKKAGTKAAFRHIDFEIPAMIATLAQEMNVDRLAVISSIGADARSSSFYLRTKGEMEKEVREVFQGNLVIFRPSLLMGKRGEFRFGEKAAILFMKVFGWLFIGPLSKYRGIDATDVARAMISAVSGPDKALILESDRIQEIAGLNRHGIRTC